MIVSFLYKLLMLQAYHGEYRYQTRLEMIQQMQEFYYILFLAQNNH